MRHERTPTDRLCLRDRTKSQRTLLIRAATLVIARLSGSGSLAVWLLVNPVDDCATLHDHAGGAQGVEVA